MKKISKINFNFSENLCYIAQIGQKRILNRSNVSVCFNENCEYNINLSIDENIKCDYILDLKENCVSIIGSSFINLVGGLGKWLHNSIYKKDYIIPCELSGEWTGKCEVRGMYLASHFYNFYQIGEEEKIIENIEDIALWGINYISALMPPIINLYSKEDPNIHVFRKQAERILNAAKKLGMKYSTGFGANTDFKIQREDLVAEPNIDPHGRRGNNGENICPNRPGALEYIKSNFEYIFDNFNSKDIDLITISNYDEGGCGCDKCNPYAVNGTLKIWEYIKDMVREKTGGADVCFQSWMLYDDFPEEWEGVIDYLNKNEKEFDYVMINTEYPFQKYPLNHKIPRKLINFPEISMWGIFPWGGFGANPIPNHLKEVLWDEKDIISGGFPYCEGPAVDINIALISELYFNRTLDFDNVLSEYISYEYSEEVIDDVKELIKKLEYNQDKFENMRTFDEKILTEAEEIAERVNNNPDVDSNYWRWRILYIRAMLERERLVKLTENPKVHKIEWSEEATEYMRELNVIYGYEGKYIGVPSDNHSWVAPPLWMDMYHEPPIHI